MAAVLFKVTGRAVWKVLLLLILMIVALPFFIDPNDHKPTISALIQRATGIRMTLHGPIQLSIFPTIDLTLKEVTGDHLPGFGSDSFLKADHFEIKKLEILPLLLRQEVALDRLSVTGGHLRLTTTGTTDGINAYTIQNIQIHASSIAVNTLSSISEILRHATFQGTAQANSMTLKQIQISDFQMTAKSHDGVTLLAPVTMRLYDGDGAFSAQINFQKPTHPQWSLNASLKGIHLETLLRDGAAWDLFSGTARLRADLKTEGMSLDRIQRNLEGTVQFTVRDGALRGIDIAQLIRETYATLKNRPPPPAQTPQETRFLTLSGTGTLTREGGVHQEKLQAETPVLNIHGTGNANWIQEQLDYALNVSVTGKLEEEIQQIKGLVVPLQVQGDFHHPRFQVALEPLLRSAIKTEAASHLEKKWDDLVEKHLGDQTSDSLKTILKQLPLKLFGQ